MSISTADYSQAPTEIINSEPSKPLVNKKPKVLLIALLSFISIFCLIYFILFKTFSIYEPSYLPPGFKKLTRLLPEKNDPEKHIITEYYHPQKGIFALTQKIQTINCKPPKSGSIITDYRLFLPVNSTDGCAFTFNSQSGSKHTKQNYDWQIGNTQLKLLSHDFNISDNEALMVADSLELKKVKASKLVSRINLIFSRKSSTFIKLFHSSSN